jgi:hypothetical protein
MQPRAIGRTSGTRNTSRGLVDHVEIANRLAFAECGRQAMG